MTQGVGTYVRDSLKVLKADPEQPLRSVEMSLERGVFLANDPGLLRPWYGEILHQLALRRMHRGDVAMARTYFKLSLEHLEQDGTALAHARTLRDYALLEADTGDVDNALRMIARALELHGDDDLNQKGRRQRRITETYLWRINCLASEDNQHYVEQLLGVALHGCDDWCPRDHEALLVFVMNRVTCPRRHNDLLLTRVRIEAKRRRLGRTLTSLAIYLLDTELIVARKIVRTMFRRE